MHHYTYLITKEDLNNLMFYIGVRSCKCDPKEDDYMSSSKYVKADIELLGLHCFSKKILKCFSTREEAVQHEIDLHNLYDVGSAPHFYNRAKQTSIGWDMTGTTPSQETIEKRRIAQTGKKRSEEARANISVAMTGKKWSQERKEEKANFFKNRTDEQRAKHSAINKGRKHSEEHRKKHAEAIKGRKMSDNTKEKLSQIRKGKPKPESFKQKMREYWERKRQEIK